MGGLTLMMNGVWNALRRSAPWAQLLMRAARMALASGNSGCVCRTITWRRRLRQTGRLFVAVSAAQS